MTPRSTLLCLSLVLVSFACSDSGEGDSAGAAHAAERADRAIEAIAEADPNTLMELQRELLGETVDALRGVTDRESARAAGERLAGLAERVPAIVRRREELMGGLAADRGAFARETMQFMAELGRLTEQFERLEEVEGAREVLEPAMDGILGLFDPSRR